MSWKFRVELKNYQIYHPGFHEIPGLRIVGGCVSYLMYICLFSPATMIWWAIEMVEFGFVIENFLFQ